MRSAPGRATLAGSGPLKDAMLTFLFRRLTAEPARGKALFAAVTAEAREPHWYIEGAVPDTLDGRFAALTTVAALAVVRLEQESAGDILCAALIERFIETMESEHREMGIGDPTLGKRMRKLVGSLSRRTDLWRGAAAGAADWAEATRESLYKDEVSPDALTHSAQAMRELWTRLQRTECDALAEGKIG